MQQFVHIWPIKDPQRPLMSRQLTISSLFSAFALVTLALFARAGVHADMPVVQGDLIVQVHDVSDLSR